MHQRRRGSGAAADQRHAAPLASDRADPGRAPGRSTAPDSGAARRVPACRATRRGTHAHHPDGSSVWCPPNPEPGTLRPCPAAESSLSPLLPYGERTVFSHGWLLADINGDGAVTDGDYTILVGDWGTSKPASPADLNGDGKVSDADYTIWSDAYGDSAPADDPLVLHPRLESFRNDSPVSLCDIGHQGLLHDKEFGLIYNRARMLHPTVGRFVQRDPAGYIDGVSLHQYASGRPVNMLDPSGKGTLPLDILAKRIQDYLDNGLEGMAADVALDLYETLARLGAPMYPLSSALMSNWLAGPSQSDPYVLSEPQVYGAITDDSGPREQLKAKACSWIPKTVDSKGTLPTKRYATEATSGDYHYALGQFRVAFLGRYECDEVGNCTFDGTWSLRDRYNWIGNGIGSVLGTVIHNSWARLVEKYHGASPFLVIGVYIGPIEVKCACNPASGGSGGGAEDR